METNSSLTYSQALQELNTLVQELQSDTIDVDQLSEKVKRASFLIKFCKGKLRDTDEEVKKVLDDLDVESIECALGEEEEQ